MIREERQGTYCPNLKCNACQRSWDQMNSFNRIVGFLEFLKEHPTESTAWETSHDMNAIRDHLTKLHFDLKTVEEENTTLRVELEVETRRLKESLYAVRQETTEKLEKQKQKMEKWKLEFDLKMETVSYSFERVRRCLKTSSEKKIKRV